MRSRAAAVLVAAVACALPGASGAAAGAAPPGRRVCLTAERRALARALGVRATAIAEHELLASNGMPQCDYGVARPRRRGPATRVLVTVNVDSGPQAAWRLMRKVVEAGQLFGPVPKGFRPPVGVLGLGPYASWFPALGQLMATDLRRHVLLTVGVSWRRATGRQRLALARAAVVPYRRVRRYAA